MTRPMTHRAIAAGFGLAATLSVSLGLPGCGGATQDSGEAVVVIEPGAALPKAGTAGSSSAPATTTITPDAATTGPAAAPAKSEGWGTLKGQVVFGGSPPPSAPLREKGKAEKDPEYCAKDAPIPGERLVVDASTKGVKNALVFFALPKSAAIHEESKSAASKTEVVFDQAKCVFEPHVLGVMKDTKIVLKSSDPVNHNVNAKLQKNGASNQLVAAHQSLPYTPRESERSPSSVTCDIHPWMQAWWMILDHPYFAVTDAKGNFEIKNVPAGAQKVVVWQEATGFVTPPSGVEVAIAANDTTSKTFTIDPGTVKPAK